MSSTNKTTHYDLPQWIGTDKPTFLGDLNGAFSTIDTQLYTAVTNAENANNNATSAAGAVNNMQNDVNNLKTWQTAASSAISGLQNSVTGLTPVISSASKLFTGQLSTYLSSYSPVFSANDVNMRTITIDNLKFLNIYGGIAISYTGTPAISDVLNVALLTLNNIYTMFNIATGREFYNVGQLCVPLSDGNTRIIPINIISDGSSAKLSLPVGSTDTMQNTTEVTAFFQCMLCLN